MRREIFFRNNKHYEYFMVHFQVVNGTGNKLHPQIVLTKMIFSQTYLPGKQSSSGYIYFVCFATVEIGLRPASIQIYSGVFAYSPKRKMSSKMNLNQCVWCAQVRWATFILHTLCSLFLPLIPHSYTTIFFHRITDSSYVTYFFNWVKARFWLGMWIYHDKWKANVLVTTACSDNKT